VQEHKLGTWIFFLPLLGIFLEANLLRDFLASGTDSATAFDPIRFLVDGCLVIEDRLLCSMVVFKGVETGKPGDLCMGQPRKRTSIKYFE
jgi:hypothetical protein